MKVDKIFEANTEHQTGRAVILGEEKNKKATFILAFCLEALSRSQHKEVESKREQRFHWVDEKESEFGSVEAAGICREKREFCRKETLEICIGVF